MSPWTTSSRAGARRSLPSHAGSPADERGCCRADSAARRSPPPSRTTASSARRVAAAPRAQRGHRPKGPRAGGATSLRPPTRPPTPSTKIRRPLCRRPGDWRTVDQCDLKDGGGELVEARAGLADSVCTRAVSRFRLKGHRARRTHHDSLGFRPRDRTEHLGKHKNLPKDADFKSRGCRAAGDPTGVTAPRRYAHVAHGRIGPHCAPHWQTGLQAPQAGISRSLPRRETPDGSRRLFRRGVDCRRAVAAPTRFPDARLEGTRRTCEPPEPCSTAPPSASRRVPRRRRRPRRPAQASAAVGD